MAKKKSQNPFEDFVKTLNMNGLPNQEEVEDADAKLLDSFLAKWLETNFPEGFTIEEDKRNLMLKTLKEVKQTNMKIPMLAYVDAFLYMIWTMSSEPKLAMSMRMAFMVGYAFSKVSGKTDRIIE